MIYPIRLNDEFVEKFDKVVRQIAVRENRNITRPQRIKELMQKDIDFNENN